MSSAGPIVYVRGYAGLQSEVEVTVDDPTYGFNAGSTHIRLGLDGKADFYMFVSPFARLFRDHGYQDVIDGAVQQLPSDIDPDRTIWIYRYYDPTSKTFDRPGGRRLSIEAAAEGLREFISSIRDQVRQSKIQKGQNDAGDCKVHLIAHSMGGLVARCLIQKIYAPHEAAKNIDKLFTYGTPHGGIHFDIAGGGVIERLRDFVGFNDSDNFGPSKMYRFLSRNPGSEAPDDWDPQVIDADSFDIDRVFCVIGTNAEDYAVAAGLSRAMVGPQSDGLVQIENAFVHGAHRAYIHRSHSGRYGMVNSEEGYQNLQRFLFGNVKVSASLTDFKLKFSSNDAIGQPAENLDGRDEVSYFVESQISIRGLPMLMHERTLRHYSADAVNADEYRQSGYDQANNKMPLFTTFLFQGRRDDGTMRYMVRLAVYKQIYEAGFLVFGEHLERLPLWSDYLIVELTPLNRRGERITSTSPEVEKLIVASSYLAKYCWASLTSIPNEEFLIVPPKDSNPAAIWSWRAPLVGSKFGDVLGHEASVLFEGFAWK